MVHSTAETVEEYLDGLTETRREAISAVRRVILENLPEGIVETMNWGMISYEVPLDVFPDTYNKRPLQYAALASQKRHMAVYLTPVYSDPETGEWFRKRYSDSGCRMDMGKSCVRFRKLDDLPLELIGEAVARMDLEQFLNRYREVKG